MAEDSNPNRPFKAEDNQDQGAKNPAGPKGTQTWGSGAAPAGRGGSPAEPVKADPEPEPDSNDAPPKAKGTYGGGAGTGRG